MEQRRCHGMASRSRVSQARTCTLTHARTRTHNATQNSFLRFRFRFPLSFFAVLFDSSFFPNRLRFVHIPYNFICDVLCLAPCPVIIQRLHVAIYIFPLFHSLLPHQTFIINSAQRYPAYVAIPAAPHARRLVSVDTRTIVI